MVLDSFRWRRHNWAATAKSRRRQGMLLAMLSLVLLSPGIHADERDALWTHTAPPAIATAPHDPQQSFIFRHVLEQMQTPLITSHHDEEKLGQQATTQRSAEPAPEIPLPPLTLRFAVRPDGIDGWRPAGTQSVPVTEPWGQPAARIAQPEPASQSESWDDDRADEQQLPYSDAAPSGPRMEHFEDLLSGAVKSAPPSDRSFPPREEQVDSIVPDESDDSGQPSAAPSPESSPAATPAPAEPSMPPPLTPQLMQLRSRVRGVLKGYYRKPLNSREHDPWQVMHGMLAYGINSRVLQGGPKGPPVTSVGWLCYNKPCKGQSLLYVTPQGELRAKYGVGLQGHLGQFLAMLAQCRVAPDYPIRVGKHEFTIADLIEAEKKTCYEKSELTFKLIAFQAYLELDDEWVSEQGVEWDIPRLVREELAQPIRGAACGGTHRLSGLSLTVKKRLRRGEVLDGEYARAAEFVEKYHQYAFRLQNRDGSLSTSWFQGRGEDSDLERRLKTTGHTLEWLCYSLSDEELRDVRTIRAVSYLTNLLVSNYTKEWEVGAMCHAIHALVLYDERVFKPFDGGDYDVANRPKPPAGRRYPQQSGRR